MAKLISSTIVDLPLFVNTEGFIIKSNLFCFYAILNNSNNNELFVNLHLNSIYSFCFVCIK